ncbi:hypothetical protein AHAS_Ahas03G0204900 [Arachis hypogaea]
MALGSKYMSILPWEVVVESSIHLVVANFHILGVVHLGNNMEGVALESIEGHMEVFSGMGLVSMVVQSYVEEGVHRHMVVVLESHKWIHHSHWIDMHHRMALLHSALVEVVAMRIGHMHMAPPTFDCPILDTNSH